MKTKKTSLLLAILVGIGMTLSGTAKAAPEMFILEIQASGKGYEAITDNTPVYIESKHKMDTFPLYALCDPEDSEILLAYYEASFDSWDLVSINNIINTENNLLINVPSMITVYMDSNDSRVYSSGAMVVQFKEKDGAIKSAKLKSLAMSYWQDEPYNTTGNLQRFGALKMKGKKVEWEELPPAVQAIFD